MLGLLLWLWICFAGGIGLLLEGETATGAAAVGAGVVTIVYLATASGGGRWVIRAVLVVLWLGGGLLLWSWTVEDWAVALRIAFGALGGAALIVYLARNFAMARDRRAPRQASGGSPSSSTSRRESGSSSA